MTTTDYVPVDALKSYIEHFIEESENNKLEQLKCLILMMLHIMMVSLMLLMSSSNELTQ